jgi:hypothetical protein
LALAPVQPIPNQIALAPERVISTLAVELAASTIDPITPWVQTFETAAANVGTLVEFYLQKPFPLLQAVVANLGTYAEELENGQGDLIPEQIWGNVQTFFQAPWEPGAQVTLPAETTPPTEVVVPLGTYLSETEPVQPDSSSALSPADGNLILLQLAASAALNPDSPTNVLPLSFFLAFDPVWNFLNTNYSGQLLGLLGPLISPLVQVVKSFTAVGAYFEAGDVAGAINELINIPANTTNAFLNGAGFLDLTGIVASVVGELPEGAKVGLNMGGLLNAMPVDGSLDNPDDPPTTWSGGTGFVSFAVSLGDSLPSIPGLPNGWAGSVIGLGQFLGDQLVVTPPAPPPVAAEPEAAKLAAPADISAVTEAPVEEAAPAVVDVPAEESAPAVADVPAEDPAPAVAEVAAEDPAPAVEELAEVEAAVEAVEASESEPAEAVTPAAEDSGPEAADSDKSADDTDRSGGNDRRGAS